MRLVDLMRQGRFAEAIEQGAGEIQVALDAYEAGDDDQGDEGGIVTCLPHDACWHSAWMIQQPKIPTYEKDRDDERIALQWPATPEELLAYIIRLARDTREAQNDAQLVGRKFALRSRSSKRRTGRS